MSTRAWVVLGIGLVVTTGAEVAAGLSGWVLMADALVAAVLTVLVAVTLDDHPRYAAVGALAAASWLVSGLAPATTWIHRGLVVWLVVAFPAGRLSGRSSLALVAAAAAVGVLPGGPARAVGMAVVALGVVGFVMREAGPARSWTPFAAPSRRAGVLAGLAFAVPLLTLSTGASGPGIVLAAEVAYGLLVAAAVCVLVLAARSLEAGTERVIALSESEGSGLTLKRLREARRDDLDADGRRVLDSAIGMLERNVALHAELRHAVERARQARRHLSGALEKEQIALRRQVSEHAVPALDSIGDLLTRVAEDATDPAAVELFAVCRSEAEVVRAELADLAEGLHPIALRDRGLQALAEALGHGPVPVVVEMPATRLPPDVEAAVWFSCGELVANALKHGHPSRVTVTGVLRAGRLTVLVRDDGVGGARVVPGGGLSALRGRLAGVDGSLHISAPQGGGTAALLEVPLP